MMSESSSRWIAAIILFLTTAIGSIGPIYLINRFVGSRQKKNIQISFTSSKELPTEQKEEESHQVSSHRHAFIMRFLTQIGGGILLYTSFIHMLPEIRDNFRDLVNSENKNYPLSSLSLTGHHIPWSFIFWSFDSTKDLASVPPIVDMFACFGFFLIFIIEQIVHSLLKSYSYDDSFNNVTQTTQDILIKDVVKEDKIISDNNENCHKIFTDRNKKKSSFYQTIVDCSLLILAFSCHAFFDGIAIGSQNGSRIWSILIAILTHKFLIALILCHQVYVKALSSGSKHLASTILCLFGVIFAALSPLGIILVQIITGGLPSDENIIIIFLASLSTGTLLYIVFVEILSNSRGISKTKQLIALVIGFVVMHVISQFFQD